MCKCGAGGVSLIPDLRDLLAHLHVDPVSQPGGGVREEHLTLGERLTGVRADGELMVAERLP